MENLTGMITSYFTRISRGVVKACLGLSWLTFLALFLLRVDFGGLDDEVEVVHKVSK